MFSHIMIGTNHLEHAKQFYDAVLGVLGAGEPMRNQAPSGHARLFYLHDGGMFCVTEPINGEPATFANGGTIGFKCHSPEQVQAFHDVAVAHGGQSIEAPPGRGIIGDRPHFPNQTRHHYQYRHTNQIQG